MIQVVKSYEAFHYLEVWEITNQIGDLVYETRNTGKFIMTKQVGALPRGFLGVAVSAGMLICIDIQMDVIDVSEVEGLRSDETREDTI